MRPPRGDDPPLTPGPYAGGVRAWAFLLPTGLFLLAFTYLPALRILVEGLSALPRLLTPENGNALCPDSEALERELPALRERMRPDFVLANGENLDLTRPEAGKAGMTLPSLERLFRLGVDAVTGGTTPSIPRTWKRCWPTPGSSAP